MKVCYFDAIGGVSGDMLVSAILDATNQEDFLISALKKLPIAPWEWQRQETKKNGFRGSSIGFLIQKDQPLRHMSDIETIIRAAQYKEAVTKKILAVFDLLAVAESAAHGIPKEEVHFHEVGADDTILDIAAVVLLLENLGIDRLHASPLPMGYGTCQSCHGVMPLPAPALSYLLQGVSIFGVEEKCETVTPTGIALLRSFHATFGTMPQMKVDSVGTGCGTKDMLRPNLLRCFLGEDGKSSDLICSLTCTVDDMTGEDLGNLWDIIFQVGAKDMNYTAVQMKKGRPGVKITVLAAEADVPEVEKVLFTHTSTLGIILSKKERRILERSVSENQTPYGSVRIKRGSGQGISRIKAENDDLVEIRRSTGLPTAYLRKTIEKDCENNDD